MQNRLPVKKRHIRRWKLHFPRYRLVKVSWNSIQPFPRTVVSHLCTIFLADRWSQKIPNFSIVFSIGVYGSKFTKFSTLVEHHGDCLPWKYDGGLQQKILRESPKTWNFCTCTCKSAHCVYLGGSKVKVEHTPCKPLSYGSTAVLSVQKFASVPEL